MRLDDRAAKTPRGGWWGGWPAGVGGRFRLSLGNARCSADMVGHLFFFWGYSCIKLVVFLCCS